VFLLKVKAEPRFPPDASSETSPVHPELFDPSSVIAVADAKAGEV
jgi:hypothetical protein